MSTIQIHTYINFQGRAREAMEWYQAALGGTLDLQTLSEQGQPKPAGPGDAIMYARLDVDGAVIIGSDGRPNHPATVGENMALALSGTDRERLTKAFNTLAKGGTIGLPLTDTPYGATAGWVTDKFAIIWQITITKA